MSGLFARSWNDSASEFRRNLRAGRASIPPMRTHSSARMGTLALAVLIAGAAGCDNGATSSSEPARLPSFSAAARGGSVVLDADRLVAWVADADNRAVHHVDLRTRAVRTTELPGRPEQLVRVGDAGLAVTLRETNQVALYRIDEQDAPEQAGALSLVATADVASDPYGIALSPRGELIVTSGWGHTVTTLAADTLERRHELDVAREPRGVVVSPDGARAYVTHQVGPAITIVSLDGEQPSAYSLPALGGKFKNRLDRATGAGTLHPTASLAFSAALSPSGARLFVPHTIEQNGADTTRSIPGAYGGVPVEEETSFASVAVLATDRGEVLGAEPMDAHPVDGLLPIAVDPSLGFAVAPEPAPCRQARSSVIAGDALLVASQGTNQLVELDARAIDPATSVRRLFAVGEGPTGVDADEATGIAITWNQLSHDLSIVHLASGATESIPVATDPLPPDVAAGRRLFLTERDRRITRDGRACAGCHPEGRDDGLVWKLGAGPRQTPMLVGRLTNGPYGWLAKHDRLEDNMRETMTRLGGTALPEEELRKLAAFLREGLRAPNTAPRPGKEPDAETQRLVARGKELFLSDQVGCHICHLPDRQMSDRSLHIVGTRSKTDTTDSYRTPPLLFVGGTAPYFHDGRYPTLEALLADNFDRMGTTSQLSPEDLRALAAYLKTL
jgi:mono/diheme cytochrome c family protein